MSLRTRCPSCDAVLSMAEDKSGKKVRCPKCSGQFTARPEGASGESPGRRETFQQGPSRRPAAPQWDEDDEDRPGRRRTVDDIPPVRPGTSPMLLVGVALGAIAVLGGAGVLTWILMRESPQAEARPDASNPTPVAQVKPKGDGGDPLPAVPAPPAVEVVLPGAGAAPGEQFVDLPERSGDDSPTLPGFDMPRPPGQPPAAGVPGATPRVVLANGRAGRVRGRAGVSFRIEYRFIQGGPTVGAVRYAWVIQTARGRAFKQTLMPRELRAQGTLSGRALGTAWFDAPYTTYLAIERLGPGGWQSERISEVATIR